MAGKKELAMGAVSMPPTKSGLQTLRYRLLYPDWSGPRPVTFFMLENLLEARADSSFPTGSRGADEDVNIYLAHLLSEHVLTPIPTPVRGGGEPLLLPPEKSETTRGEGAEHYRRNGDHRLVCLGLYGRGDLRRRRHPPWGWTEKDVRLRDLADGRNCYIAAARLLQGNRASRSALVPILTKLARFFDGYVHVLEVLARRRLGLGAQLSGRELKQLEIDSQPPGTESARDGSPCMDELLDLLSAYQRQPTSAGKQELEELALKLGLDPRRILPPSFT